MERRFTNYTRVDGPPQVNKILFSEIGDLKTRPLGNKSINYFGMLLTDEFIEFIVQETNLYAVEIFISTAGNLSKISQWKNTTVKEMKIFFTLFFYTGTIRTNRSKNFWKTSDLFNLIFFLFTQE